MVPDCHQQMTAVLLLPGTQYQWYWEVDLQLQCPTYQSLFGSR